MDIYNSYYKIHVYLVSNIPANFYMKADIINNSYIWFQLVLLFRNRKKQGKLEVVDVMK